LKNCCRCGFRHGDVASKKSTYCKSNNEVIIDVSGKSLFTLEITALSLSICNFIGLKISPVTSKILLSVQSTFFRMFQCVCLMKKPEQAVVNESWFYQRRITVH
jgi:hypothetical protein